MKKSKTTSKPELAEKDREAIEKAAAALNAFAESTTEPLSLPTEEGATAGELSLNNESHDFIESVSKATEAMAAWDESEAASAEDLQTEGDDIAFSEDDTEDFVLLEEEDGDGLEMAEEGDPAETLDLEANVSEAETQEVEGTELEGYESAEIEDVHFLTTEQTHSIIESVLFSTDKPISLAYFRQIFRGTNIKNKEIKACLEQYASELAEQSRGVTLEEVSTGYQLRTKIDNSHFLRASVKARPFKLSGPALETLSIVAYKQPVTKAQIDEIRGVESGHLLRALMEKSLVSFGEKSDLPGKPMFYETTRKFLEIFGLRNIRELPSLHEIDQLIPEGIGDEEKKETLGDLTEQLSQELSATYSEGEEELHKITAELSDISTSSEFFEQEKQRLRDKRDQERAQDIREAIALGETVDEKEMRWLERYDQAELQKAHANATGEPISEPSPTTPGVEAPSEV